MIYAANAARTRMMRMAMAKHPQDVEHPSWRNSNTHPKAFNNHPNSPPTTKMISTTTISATTAI